MLATLVDFYAPLFRAGANFAFGRMGGDRVARFEPFDDPSGVFDTRMSIGKRVNGRALYPTGMGLNSVRQGFAPTALFLALSIATPIRWRRKRTALLVGLLLVQSFVALRLWIALMAGFAQTSYQGNFLLDVSEGFARLLRRADQIVAGDLHLTYVAPIAIWAAVMLGRKGGLADLREALPAETVKPHARGATCACGSGKKFKRCCGRPML